MQDQLDRIEKMLVEIYKHLGLSGQRPFSFNQLQEDVKKDILKRREKKAMKGHERALTP